MFAPRRLGGGKDVSEPGKWVVRYVGKDVYGRPSAVDAYGIGGTPLEATEDAWANFQAEQRLGQDSRQLDSAYECARERPERSPASRFVART